nr:hypothetical protein [Tanacetum cinerariifolium]
MCTKDISKGVYPYFSINTTNGIEKETLEFSRALAEYQNSTSPFPLLEKLTGAEPVSGPKTIKSILKLKSTFKPKTLKGIIINEPSLAPARGNKSSSCSKTNSVPAEAWLNSSNKVNQCISDQIPTQKKKILGIDQLTEDTFSSGPKDLIFKKSSTYNVSITDSNKPSCSTPLPPLKKLDGVEHVSEPKTIKLILKSKSTFKADTLKAPAGKLKNVKMEDDPLLAIVNLPQDPDLQGQQYLFLPAHIVDITIINMMIVYTIPKREALQAKKAEYFKASKIESSSALRSKTPTKRDGPRIP